jgi:hypothetical protein
VHWRARLVATKDAVPRVYGGQPRVRLRVAGEQQQQEGKNLEHCNELRAQTMGKNSLINSPFVSKHPEKLQRSEGHGETIVCVKTFVSLQKGPKDEHTS